MANTRSAEKQMRQAEKAKVRNRAGRTRLRSAIKKAKGAIEEGTGDVKEVVRSVTSEIDKASKKELIKKNTASRYKSRISALAKRTTK